MCSSVVKIPIEESAHCIKCEVEMDCRNVETYFRVSLVHVVHMAGMEKMETLVNPETLETLDLLEIL